jgi:transposase
MKKITTVGFDIAKSVFHVVGSDQHGNMVKRKKISRSGVMTFFSNLPPCLVGIEACQSAHHWGRELNKLGHEVKLIAAQKVKPFLQGNKTDYNDALAISEAIVRPTMRFVPVKTVEQQDQELICRRKEKLTRMRTAQAHQIRATLAERGWVFPKGYAHLRRQVEVVLGENPANFSATFLHTLVISYGHFNQLSDWIGEYEGMIKEVVKQDSGCQKLCQMSGFGPIVAYAFRCHVGDGTAFSKGRDVSASLGIVPRQHSTGDKPNLMGISKRGNRHLRYLLIHGARAAICHSEGKQDPLSRWMQRLIKRVGKNKAIVAYANKMARVGWAIVRYDTAFDSTRAALIIDPA